MAVLAYGAAEHSVNADAVVEITVSIAVRGIGYLTGTFHDFFLSFSIFHGIPPPPPTFFCSCGLTAILKPRPPHCWGYEITIRHTTLGRNPLNEESARRGTLYLKIHNTHKRQTSVLPAGFEPVVAASERPQTCPLDRATTHVPG